MRYFPFSLIGKAAESGLTVDFNRFKTDDSNFLLETVRFEKSKSAPREQYWTIGFLVRDREFDNLIADDTGHCDRLTAFLDGLVRSDAGDDFTVYGLDRDEPENLSDDEYHYFAYRAVFYVIDKKKA